MFTRPRYKFNLVKAYLSPERDFRFPVTELWHGFTSVPHVRLGARFITSIEEEAHYLRVYLKDTIAPLYWPKELSRADLHRVLAECFDETDWHFYEVPETRVTKGDVVLDCGAAEGTFTLRVLDRASRVIAFEPFPLFQAGMALTFADFPHVSIVPLAVGERSASAFLEGTSLYGHVSSSNRGVPIEISTIDEQMASWKQPVHFIKADVEGFEMALLKGAAETIRRHSPKLALTVYHGGNEWKPMTDFLRALVPGYRFFTKGISFKGKGIRPMMLHAWVE